jgi:hypothetical protein
MNLKLTLADSGNIAKERVILEATTPDDMANYAVFCCLTADEVDTVSTGDIPKVFWFEDRKMNKGDLVILYTKEGATSEKKNKNGSTSTFYYWGVKAPLWIPKRRPVLVHIPNYIFGDVVDEDMTTAERA